MFAVLFLVPLAGCFHDTGRPTVNAVTLTYEGEGAGTHRENNRCSDDAELRIVADVPGGWIQVRVEDGASRTIHDQNVTGQAVHESHRLDGNRGSWGLIVERSRDFEGAYEVTLAC
jgi:hypothetical protein